MCLNPREVQNLIHFTFAFCFAHCFTITIPLWEFVKLINVLSLGDEHHMSTLIQSLLTMAEVP